MSGNKGGMKTIVQPPAKSSKLAKVPVLRKKPKSNLISLAKDPSRMFEREGCSLTRIERNVTLVLRSKGNERKAKIVAQFSKSALGPYVIKFYDSDLLKVFERKLSEQRLLKAGKKRAKP